MLDKEQVEYFQQCVAKATRIVGKRRMHIRVSGRQLADKSWCVGLIYGCKGEMEWLFITNVATENLINAKQIYRAMLKDLTTEK